MRQHPYFGRAPVAVVGSASIALLIAACTYRDQRLAVDVADRSTAALCAELEAAHRLLDAGAPLEAGR